MNNTSTKRPRPGRPSLDGGNGGSPVLQIKLTRELLDALRLKTAQTGRTSSEIVRNAIAQYVAN